MAHTSSSRIEALSRSLDESLQRLEKLEQGLSTPLEADSSGYSWTRRPLQRVDDPRGTAKRLGDELESMGVREYAFVRAPKEYYDRDLDFRRQVLNAPTIDHLCKSIVMENTKVDGSDPSVVKYWLVIVQYNARLSNEALRAFVLEHHKGALPKSKVNMRLVAEGKSNDMTGFTKNAVTPIGMKNRLPIVLAKEIADLHEFWLGGGEVDLKVGLPVDDFVRAYKPFIVPLSQS